MPWLAIASLLASPTEKSPKAADAVRGVAKSAAVATPAVATSAAAATPADTSSPAWIPGKKGPWGQIDTMPLALDAPVDGEDPVPQQLGPADLQPDSPSSASDAKQGPLVKAPRQIKPGAERAVLARLRLGPDADLDEIAQYWGLGGRRKDLLPFLTSLHRVDGGCNVNLVYLLPDFARERLYRRPTAPNNLGGAADQGVKQDCFWSAFNFFNDVPDNSVEDTHTLAGLDRYYDPISVPNQLGDVLILTARDGVPLHAAVFLADDVYFTKNGTNRAQPWILMRLADVLETYHFQHSGSDPAEIHYFRRKGF